MAKRAHKLGFNETPDYRLFENDIEQIFEGAQNYVVNRINRRIY